MFVSQLSEITVLCLLVSSVLRPIILCILSSVLVLADRKMNLVFVTLSRLEVEIQPMNLNKSKDISHLIQ